MTLLLLVGFVCEVSRVLLQQRVVFKDFFGSNDFCVTCQRVIIRLKCLFEAVVEGFSGILIFFSCLKICLAWSLHTFCLKVHFGAKRQPILGVKRKGVPLYPNVRKVVCI